MRRVNQRHLSARSFRPELLAMAAVFSALLVFVSRADAGERYVVIKTDKTITVGGKEVNDAAIVIVGGKIEAVGKNVDYPSDSRVIDASKWVAMPGMINPRTLIGVTLPQRGGNSSHSKVADDFKAPEDDTYRELLESGYTLLGVLPNGRGLPGQALVISTHNPDPKKAARSEGLIRVTFTQPPSEKEALRNVLKEAKKAIDQEKEAASKPAEKKEEKKEPESKPADKKEEGKDKTPTSQPTSQPTSKPAEKKEEKKEEKKPEIKPELQGPVKLLKKEDNYAALVEFARASDVLHFEQAIDGYEFESRFAFSGNSYDDLHNIIEHALIGGADASVVMRPLLPNMPLTVNPYNVAQELLDEGCTVSFYPISDDVREHDRMRERLALLVRAGLSRESAIAGLTLSPAKYLGIEKEYGSLEKDKVADVVLLDGDPMDPFAKVQMVIVGGEVVYDRAKDKKDKR